MIIPVGKLSAVIAEVVHCTVAGDQLLYDSFIIPVGKLSAVIAEVGP
jgi:hypothetical protein